MGDKACEAIKRRLLEEIEQVRLNKNAKESIIINYYLLTILVVPRFVGYHREELKCPGDRLQLQLGAIE